MVQSALILILITGLTANASRSEPCGEHKAAIYKIRHLKASDVACAGQIDHTARILERGLALCQQRNGLEVKPMNCSPRPDRVRGLREVGEHVVDESIRGEDAGALNTQYHGIADALIEKPGNCLNRIKGLKKAIACGLPRELGQRPKEEGGWNKFWNREKSKAPFADSISPEFRMLATTGASAALWRGVRGGGWMPGEQSYSTQRRLITAAGYTGLGWFNGGTDGAIAGALMTPSLFLPYGKFMQKQHGNRRFTDALYMTGIGLAGAALPAAYLYMRGYNPLPMLLGGGAKGLCYFGSYQWGKGAFANSPDKAFVGGVETQTAELCHGATQGLGLSASLLYSNNEPEPVERSRELCD